MHITRTSRIHPYVTSYADQYPLMLDENFLTVDRVYRCEDSNGWGPFMNKSIDTTVLKYHELPIQLWPAMREKFDCKELGNFADRNLYRLHDAKWIYGWRSLELYKAFFKEGGEDMMIGQGFGLKVFTPSEYIPLPDGQVLFKRP